SSSYSYSLSFSYSSCSEPPLAPDLSPQAGRGEIGDAMILEGIVTTLDPDGAPHIAPMGPTVDAAMRRFTLRPFPTAQTYQNLRAHGEGVLHVTDDVLLLARAALGPVEPLPPLIPAARVRGFVLADACRYYEFRVVSFDDSGQRVQIDCEVIHTGRLRDFFGFN